MSRGREGRIRQRRGTWATIGHFLREKYPDRPPATFRDDSTVSDFLRDPATVGRTPAAPHLEDYDRTQEEP